MERALGDRISWEGHAGHAVATVEGFDVLQCGNCGFVHVVPLPDARELELYYRESFYQSSKPQYFASVSQDCDWLNIGHDAKLDLLKELRHADFGSNRTKPRILDIGSGPGSFLRRAQERGWDSVGLEPSPDAVKFSRGLGLQIHQGYFAGNDTWSLGEFDAIHLQHVLEHVGNPDFVLEGIGRLLRPGGRVCIEVPNDFSVVQDVAQHVTGHAPWWVAPPEHLNYFTRESLDKLLLRKGFIPERWIAQFPIDLALVGGIDYIKTPSLGTSVHSLRVRIERAFASSGHAGTLRRLYEVLAEIGFGREIIVIARYPGSQDR